MQLLRDHQTLVASVGDINMLSTMSSKDTAQENFEVKEKHSSNGSLLLMNPVASGDNVTTGLSSAHRLKEEPTLPTVPPLVPCCEGRELQINEELVHTGLSAISVKHDHSVIQCLSMSQACEKMAVPPGLIKHRNSFRSLHRPDLKRVPYLRRLTPDDLETLFQGYADLPTKKTQDSRHAPSKAAPTQPVEQTQKKQKDLVATADDGNIGGSLHPIMEMRSCPTDLPAGMRLHGARARLYTSVLAGAKAGDQLDGTASTEEYDAHVPDVTVPEDDFQFKEELQIILPPQVIGQASCTTADSTSIFS